MAKGIRSFRYKMLLLFGLSSLCSASLTYAIYKLLQMYYYTTKFENPTTKLRYFLRDVGDVNLFLLIFVPLSILFFLLFSKRYADYMNEISKGIRQLAQGDFNSPIQVRFNDEIGEIAKDINLASRNLREALERGDFAENSKEQLMLNLAHDLRTPLTSVIGYLDYILKGEELSEDQIKYYTQIAYTKSQRLEKLIDELFEIARMNYGRLTIDQEPLDLSELIIQLCEELYPVFENSQLTARINLPQNLLIGGDGELLARVFENLLTNAVRYGAEGVYIDIDGFLDQGNVVIQVANYGEVIPEEELPFIFDIFFTGDKARTQQEGSTGLGLFIAKNIVEQHQGTLTVKSNPIRTSFEVRIPQRDGRDTGGESESDS